ncbi:MULTISPECIES: hypothetical protein [Cellulophaga]|uniref:Alpha-ketoglutarate decarboxylase n=1 Tax=Cellulophaga algicola (strain DSM 14237 / IC166 / ACAM 630) TaxID=688270 RepID=E6X3Z6_CELAD|nr:MULTISPECIES: hypothetical protein [Cellulophaga]ADV49321.1 hypothetical protein Celal_2025 [Cellulophaga algicola DSM 14237]
MNILTDLFLKRWQLILFFAFSSTLTFSQNTNSGEFWDNVRFGGGIGLGFGNGYFNGSISPSAIYQVSEKFAAGVQLNFSYATFDDDTLTAYGGSLISLYNIIPAIQLSGELEQLRINRTTSFMDGDFKDNYWSPALYLGAGYVNRNFTVGLKYNVLHDEKSIYSDALIPFVRIYF